MLRRIPPSLSAAGLASGSPTLQDFLVARTGGYRQIMLCLLFPLSSRSICPKSLYRTDDVSSHRNEHAGPIPDRSDSILRISVPLGVAILEPIGSNISACPPRPSLKVSLGV
ncbi:hypothetical protein ABW19_dt0202910 [Dactylella cylindrospora]|nr:hypothetical protein ABW19_dt0202910 [Dactylella cylindrospora]